MTADSIEPEELKWMSEERQKVVDYLATEKCRHAGVADWPIFYDAPHLALWAVQSTKHVGRTGWWAISGDVPTDYMTSSDGEHPRDALQHFAESWADVAGYMRRGEQHPHMELGDPKEWPELAESLEERAQVLGDYAQDNEIWD